MRTGVSTCMALIGTCLAGGAALADTVSFGDLSATFNTVSPNSQVSISRDSGARWSTELAGQMNWTRTGGSFDGLGGTGNSGFQFASFCMELTQHVSYNANLVFNIVNVDRVPAPGGSGVGSGMGLSKADQLRELWGLVRNQVQNAATAAAFQVAVWEIVYDEDADLNAGSFRARQRNAGDTVPAIAQGWLNQLDGSHALPTLYGMSSPTAQDQVFFTVLPELPLVPANASPVPLPSAAWAGGLLLVGLVARRLRRHRDSVA